MANSGGIRPIPAEYFPQPFGAGNCFSGGKWAIRGYEVFSMSPKHFRFEIFVNPQICLGHRIFWIWPSTQKVQSFFGHAPKCHHLQKFLLMTMVMSMRNLKCSDPLRKLLIDFVIKEREAGPYSDSGRLFCPTSILHLGNLR